MSQRDVLRMVGEEVGGWAVFGAGLGAGVQLGWGGIGSSGRVGVVDTETRHLDPLQKGLVTHLLQRCGTRGHALPGAAHSQPD